MAPVRYLTLFGVLAAVGCSRYTPPPLPETVPVTGRVLLPSGQPLPAGRVVLKPTAAGGPEAVGEVKRDGSFTLTTFRTDDGALPGAYTAVVELVTYRKGAAVPVRVDMPRRYLSASTSDLKVDVTEATGELTLQMRP